MEPGVGWSARIDPGVRHTLNGGPVMKEPNVESYWIRYQGWRFVHDLARLNWGLFRIRKWTKDHT